jgi:hypothetical protein
MSMERKQVTLDDIERRLIAEHFEPFHNWLRQLVSLSSAALTLLVGLQSHYIPQRPIALWLLRLCWGSLAIVVLAGVVSLRSEWQTPLDAAKALRKERDLLGDEETARRMVHNADHLPRRFSQIAVRCTFWFFVLSVVTLATFAILNLGAASEQPRIP